MCQLLRLQRRKFSDAEARVRGHKVEHRSIPRRETLVVCALECGGDEALELTVGQHTSLPLAVLKLIPSPGSRR